MCLLCSFSFNLLMMADTPILPNVDLVCCCFIWQENMGPNGGESHSRINFVSESGALSRMTTLELKEANRKKSSPTEAVDDGVRVQSIIHDIMAKRNSSRESGKISNESEIVISLDHVHDKIQAILNRAQSTRNENDDDALCEDESYSGDCSVDFTLDMS